MQFPKKKWSRPDSPTGRPEVPESEIQAFADELLEYKKHIRSIRVPDSFFRWVKMNVPPHIQIWFFGMFGGRPDNTLLIPIGNGYSLALEMELKTQDAKGRAVGKLHGKQKRHEGQWRICRSTQEVERAIAELETMVDKIKPIVNHNGIIL